MSSQERIPPKRPTMEVDEQTKPQIKASVTTQVNANSPTKPRSPKLFTAPTNNNGPSPTTPTNEVSSVVDESKNKIDDPYFQSFPPGYRFCPLDEELIVDYLKNKILNQPLPHNRIMDVNLYHYNPENLSEKYKQCGEKEWYFFTPRERKYRNGSRPNRGADDGYWKATGADKSVKFNRKTVGFRKALVYYKGKPPKGDKTNWIMHEYRVNDPPRSRRSENDMRLDDWVLCRIYKKADKSMKTRPRDDDHSTLPHHDETNEHMGMDWDCDYDYNNVVDSTGYANTFGDYMHQPLQNGLSSIPQVSNVRLSPIPHVNNVPLGNIAKFNDQLQVLNANFGTCTKMVEPICFKPPPMHLQEGIFGSKYLNENSWGGTKSSGLQDDIWSIQNLENCDFGSQLDFYNGYMEPSINLDNILPINAPNNPPSNPPSSLPTSTITSTSSSSD